MKQIMETYAWYNRKANNSLIKILRDHSELAIRENTTYYGPVLALFSHILLSDLTWLRRLGAQEEVSASVFDIPFSSVSDRPFATLTEFADHREQLDRSIETYCTWLSEDALSLPFNYQNSKGHEFTQKRWEALLHMFNHQTHHRGQVIQVLDENGIENDVSNIIWYLRE